LPRLGHRPPPVADPRPRLRAQPADREVPRPLLRAAGVSRTGPTARDLARSIRAAQAPSGMVRWFPGGHADPWNHVEAAMALDVAQEHAAADAAYDWLLATQRPDGSWPAYSAA